MKILITGGAGFIGSNIADAYLKAGHKIVIADNLSSGKKENIPAKAKFYKVDITDAAKIKTIFLSEKPDVVSHHAAQIDVRTSVADPAYDARINIIGSLNVLEAARNAGVKKVIFSSSGGTIYGECAKKAPDEKAAARPLSPYGITKHALEFYLNFYSELYGMKFTALRYANVYGPRQDPHGEAGVVAIFSQRMLDNENLFIFGDGRQTRDYVYVGDVVSANLKALGAGHNQIINIGTGRLTSVNALFKQMASLAGYDKKPVYKPARPGELMKSFLDCRKAKKILRWQPSMPIEKGLKETIEYFAGKK